VGRSVISSARGPDDYKNDVEMVKVTEVVSSHLDFLSAQNIHFYNCVDSRQDNITCSSLVTTVEPEVEGRHSRGRQVGTTPLSP
jgi:hypothetical protein